VSLRNESSKSTIDIDMVELDLQIYYKKKCLKQAQNALAVHGDFFKGCENIRSSLAFFDKDKDSKIVPPSPITCWCDNRTMFEDLQYMSNGSTKVIK
jgi:hypothetical protein